MPWKKLANSALGASAFAMSGFGVLLELPASHAEAQAEARFPPGGQMITLDDGRQVHAVVEGSGPDLVLLHGAGGNTRDFTFSFTAALKHRYRTIVFDRPGLGYTERAGAEYGGALNVEAESPSEQAAMLKAAADKLGARRPIVLGQSYGGAVAMAWALDHDPAAVVIVSGATQPWPGGELDFFHDLAASALGGAGLAPFLAACTTRPRIESVAAGLFHPQAIPLGYVDYIGAELSLRRESFRANARQVKGLYAALRGMAPRYPALDLPVEIVHGDADAIVPHAIHAFALADQVPGAALSLLPGVGHMPHHVAADDVLAAIDRAAARTRLR